MNRRGLIGLVSNTLWNDFLELNRLALADWMPRNSESRAISAAMRIIKRSYPNIQWVVSFADACQCGDGAIYRASGFVLTAIKRNKGLVRLPSGEVIHQLALSGGHYSKRRAEMLAAGFTDWRKFLAFAYPDHEVLDGFQLRYIYFLDPTARERLTVPIIPFSEIEARGASMYRGVRRAKPSNEATGSQPEEGGAIPTPALHSNSEPAHGQ